MVINTIIARLGAYTDTHLSFLQHSGVVHVELPRYRLHQPPAADWDDGKTSAQDTQLLDGTSQVIPAREGGRERGGREEGEGGREEGEGREGGGGGREGGGRGEGGRRGREGESNHRIFWYEY